MKRNAIFFLVVMAVVSGSFSLSWGQCPDEPNDLGQCDIFYVGADIQNPALVYFDFNPPVITNTVHNSIFWLCGDVNANGVINIGDVVYLINYFYQGGPAPDPMESGDVNNSGIVDLGDALYLWAYIFENGPEPDCP